MSAGPPWANFLADAADGALHVVGNIAGKLEAILLQARACGRAFYEDDAECAATIAVDGRAGPFETDRQAAYLFPIDSRHWCHDPGEPLFFVGLRRIPETGRHVAIRAMDTGERSDPPMIADRREVAIEALDLTLVEVDEDCTVDELPCDGELFGVGTARRTDGYPAGFEPGPR